MSQKRSDIDGFTVIAWIYATAILIVFAIWPPFPWTSALFGYLAGLSTSLDSYLLIRWRTARRNRDRVT